MVFVASVFCDFFCASLTLPTLEKRNLGMPTRYYDTGLVYKYMDIGHWIHGTIVHISEVCMV